MLIKTSELIGAQLDWAVAKCEGYKPAAAASIVIMNSYAPSTDWAQGGPIIERERITTAPLDAPSTGWCAYRIHCLFDDEEGFFQKGPTPLISAMRCYVASKLGDEVEIPEELK